MNDWRRRYWPSSQTHADCSELQQPDCVLRRDLGAVPILERCATEPVGSGCVGGERPIDGEHHANHTKFRDCASHRVIGEDPTVRGMECRRSSTLHRESGNRTYICGRPAESKRRFGHEMRLVGCCHLSGLLLPQGWRRARMGVRGSDPKHHRVLKGTMYVTGFPTQSDRLLRHTLLRPLAVLRRPQMDLRLTPPRPPEPCSSLSSPAVPRQLAPSCLPVPVTSMRGLRASMPVSHDPSGASQQLAYLTTVLLPMIDKRRKVRSPILDVRPSLVLPPVDFCLGVSPSQAAKSRPRLNVSAAVASVTIAVDGRLRPHVRVVRSPYRARQPHDSTLRASPA